MFGSVLICVLPVTEIFIPIFYRLGITSSFEVFLIIYHFRAVIYLVIIISVSSASVQLCREIGRYRGLSFAKCHVYRNHDIRSCSGFDCRWEHDVGLHPIYPTVVKMDAWLWLCVAVDEWSCLSALSFLKFLKVISFYGLSAYTNPVGVATSRCILYSLPIWWIHCHNWNWNFIYLSYQYPGGTSCKIQALYNDMFKKVAFGIPLQ